MNGGYARDINCMQKLPWLLRPLELSATTNSHGNKNRENTGQMIMSRSPLAAQRDLKNNYVCTDFSRQMSHTFQTKQPQRKDKINKMHKSHPQWSSNRKSDS